MHERTGAVALNPDRGAQPSLPGTEEGGLSPRAGAVTKREMTSAR